MGPLTKDLMIKALQLLDQKMHKRNFASMTLIMGGGGAMILAHGFPRGTTDIDAIPQGASPEVLSDLVKEIAIELAIAPDWLNPYFSTFSHTLPSDYHTRLVTVFQGKVLRVEALGKEEMLIMKCFAHRSKDRPHARALIKAKTNLDPVFARIEELRKKKIPGAVEALAFLEELQDEDSE